MKAYLNILLLLITIIPFTSCENDFSYDMEGKYFDLDSLLAVREKQAPSGLIWSNEYGGYFVYLNPTRKSGLRTNIRFRLEDKEGNRLNEQIELSQIRIYEVVNGKEVMQFKYRIADGQTWPEDVPWLEPHYMWGKEWDDERIFDYYKSKGLRIYQFYGIGTYEGEEFLNILSETKNASKIEIDFYHQVTQNHGKYIIRWNDQWSDEVEFDFNWARAKYEGKIGYMSGGLSYNPSFKKMWLNGKLVSDVEEIMKENLKRIEAGESPVGRQQPLICVH